jgi:hypothetical protein
MEIARNHEAKMQLSRRVERTLGEVIIARALGVETSSWPSKTTS